MIRNLALVSVLGFMHLIIGQYHGPSANAFIDIVVTISLLAYTVRSALTQYHQQEEITHRQRAQNELTAANTKIGSLLEDARRRTYEITQINEFGNLLHACSSAPEAYRLVAERLQRLFPGASGCLSLLNDSKNRVESVAEWGVNPPSDQIFTPNECWALRRGCVHALDAGSSILRCSHLHSDESSICIPLIGNGVALGTLAIQGGMSESALDPLNRGASAFSQRLELVTAVGEHIALALADIALREALRLQAVRDPLTGLYNRRYMQEFLDREGRRARRKGRPLTVLALDLDHFKVFNDSYGHAAGDYALSLVGEVLQHSVRADDVACRYGGEEFLMILPECTLQQGLSRAEQIRVRLRQHPIEFRGVAQQAITVSIGVAAFDETTDRLERLVPCADAALYEAKHAGRDRVVAARPLPAEDKVDLDSVSSASL